MEQRERLILARDERKWECEIRHLNCEVHACKRSNEDLLAQKNDFEKEVMYLRNGVDSARMELAAEP